MLFSSSASHRDLALVVLFATCAMSFCVAIAFRHVYFPPCCDAVNYGTAAAEISSGGLFSAWSTSNLRTYAYPLFVALFSGPHELEQSGSGILTLRIPLIQSALFVMSCVLLFIVAREHRTFAWCCLVGLLVNPFVLIHVPVRLTEGLTVTIAVLMVCVAYALVRDDRRPTAELAGVACGGLLCGFALVVRPANVTLVVAWLAFCAFYVAIRLHLRTTDLSRSIQVAVLTLGSAIVPMIPQFVINHKFYKKLSPFPAANLGDSQVAWGMEMLKYATLITDHGPRGLKYLNPFFVAKVQTGALTDYLKDPLAGMATCLLHIFNSVNYDLLFTYSYGSDPWYGPLTVLLSQTLVFAGALSGGKLIKENIRRALYTGLRVQDGLLLFITAVVVTTCGLNGFVAVETRFGLLATAVLGPLAIFGFGQFLRESSRLNKIAAVSGCCLYLVAAYSVSEWVLSLAV